LFKILSTYFINLFILVSFWLVFGLPFFKRHFGSAFTKAATDREE
jgi:hypothetical protein